MRNFLGMRGSEVRGQEAEGCGAARWAGEQRMLRTHKELTVWRKSFEFCKLVYSATRRFPSEERYGLIS